MLGGTLFHRQVLELVPLLEDKVVVDEVDSNSHQNIQGAKAAGVRVGVYFYSQAISRAEAIEEAQFCIDELSGYSLDLPVVFDLEGAQTNQ